jgi:hypothetical protein
VIILSYLLLEYIKNNYPGLYFVSSTTKVHTDFDQFIKETDQRDFKYVIPDFRLNKLYDKLDTLSQVQKYKVEFYAMNAARITVKTEKHAMEMQAGIPADCP